MTAVTAMATRIYIASDLHAAEKAWRKFLNAIKDAKVQAVASN